MQTSLYSNIEQLRKQLSDIPGKMGPRILQAATVAAGKVIVKQIKQPNYAFRDRSGVLRRSAKVVRVNRRSTTGRYTFVAVQLGGPGARQAWLVEFGHEGSQRGNRRIPGAKPRAPVRRAIDETRPQQISELKRSATIEERKLARELKSGKIRPVTARALAAD